MSSLPKLAPVALLLALVAQSFAIPLTAPAKKTPRHHGHVKTIPARHNAGRPMHA